MWQAMTRPLLVAAIPAEEDEFLFISSGSCSIIGLSTKRNLESAGLPDDFAIEGGIWGQRHVVKNLMGMYYFQRCKAEWELAGDKISYQDMQEMAKIPLPFKNYIDLEDGGLLSPGSISEKIRKFCADTGQPEPSAKDEIALCITQSIAMHYKYYFERLDAITGKKDGHCIYGGRGDEQQAFMPIYGKCGEKNAYWRFAAKQPWPEMRWCSLCRQMRSAKKKEKNEIIINSFDIREYLPQNTDIWDEAYGDFLNIRNINNQPQRR